MSMYRRNDREKRRNRCVDKTRLKHDSIFSFKEEENERNRRSEEVKERKETGH